jgi:GNAT superfamily N-acetyltransferase
MAINTPQRPEKGPISEISIEPLVESQYSTYIEVGTMAYRQHYLHLWKDQNPLPYIKISFTIEVLRNEALNGNTKLFLIYEGAFAIGILKINKDHALGNIPPNEVLLLDKMYILNEYSGRGVGRQVLDFVEKMARASNKKAITLNAMKHGPALDFYKKNGFEIFDEKRLEFASVRNDQRGMYVMFKTLCPDEPN